MNSPSDSEKQTLRREMLRRRKDMSVQQRQAADDAIAARVLADLDFAAAEQILLYVSMPHEVGTERLLRACLSLGKTLGLPVCDTETHTMQFYRLGDLSELRAGAYRIPVPPQSPDRLLIPERNTLMLMPMLAFDGDGYRLGAGGGFYDRYLATYPVRTTGLCYAACRVPALPRDRYDIPMQRCITEQTTEEFSHGKS